MKEYRAKKYSHYLFVKNQKRSGHNGVTSGHVVAAIRMLTDCLERLWNKSSSPEDFSFKAGRIIVNNDSAQKQIRDLFPEMDNSNLVEDMLNLNLLKRRDRATYEKHFNAFSPDDIEGKENFFKYYMMIVSIIIEIHIFHDIVMEIYRNISSIEKENCAHIPSAENLGRVGLYKSNELPDEVEKPFKLYLVEQPEKQVVPVALESPVA